MPEQGIAGRLRAEFEDLEPGLRHAVYLELRNSSPFPVALIDQPAVLAQLRDSSGNPVDTSGIWISGPQPVPQWAQIPQDAYVGFRIDTQIAGAPTREQGFVLVAVGGNAWELGVGEYVLSATIGHKGSDDGPDNQWVGQLSQLTTSITISNEMLGIG
jgi:hypothetical protein